MEHDADDRPDDCILATGSTYKVSDFAKLAFEEVGLNWQDVKLQKDILDLMKLIIYLETFKN